MLSMELAKDIRSGMDTQLPVWSRYTESMWQLFFRDNSDHRYDDELMIRYRDLLINKLNDKDILFCMRRSVRSLKGILEDNFRNAFVSIVELGVSRGVSFFSFHKFLEIFCPTDTTKKVYGFDSFEGLTDFCEKEGRISEEHDKRVGGWSSAAGGAEVMSLNDLYNKDSIIAQERGQLIKGRVQDTLPTFLAETPGLRISLLHFDMDLYDPTMFALKALWDLVVSGGVVVFDEYGLPPWGGETNAFDEFCRERNLRVHPRKFNWCYSPTAYIVKD
jgi:hypothetical protein